MFYFEFSKICFIGLGIMRFYRRLFNKGSKELLSTFTEITAYQCRTQRNFRSLVRKRFIESGLTNSRNFMMDGQHDIKMEKILHRLQICARESLLLEGTACHGFVIQAGLQSDTLTSNILINMYSKCSFINAARGVFDRMSARSMVSWNTIISAYTRNGNHKMALELFVLMLRERTSFSEFTMSSVLCACSAKLSVDECKQLHAMALKFAMDSNVFVGTSMLDVYAKCNMIKEAFSVFSSMSEKSSVTWSSMIAGFVQNSLYEEALALLHKAQRLDLERTQFTLSSALTACAGLAVSIEGTQLHAVLVRSGIDAYIFVITSLIDVYSRCGCIEEAYVIFQHFEDKNIVVWNAMISGFSRYSRTNEALMLFENMKQNGMNPNEVTYISVLSACSHFGLVEKALDVFDSLMNDNILQPNVIHYSCMVDVLGRAGLINEAWDLICQMPFNATASMWGSLLGSCRIHGHINLAKVAAEHLFEIEPNNAANHVLLANLYAANKKWTEVATTRKFLKDSGARKELAKSWIEVKNTVEIFVAGDVSHPRILEVYTKIEDMENEMKKLSYKVQTKYDLHDVCEEEKEMLLKYHSEKLALAFGLINLPPGLPIRIHKNLRVCVDCHSFMKLSSAISNREIILRDTNRFHHFKDGLCSCKDFW